MTKSKVFKNASWIIVCKIIQSVLSLVVTMLSARYLGPLGYGLINYAASLVAFVAPIMQLGLTGVLVQEIVGTPEKEGETLGTAICMSFLSSIFCALGVIAFSAIANRGEKETIIVCAVYSILLLFQSMEMIQYWFQAKLLSKYTSIVMLIAYFLMSLYKILLLIQGASVYWFALAYSLEAIVIVAAMFLIYRKVGTYKLSFSWTAMKRMFAKSRYYIVSNLMITIFAQTDKIMLKIMVGEEATGYYAAAVACATMTGFVFSAIIDSLRPSIFESKKESVEAFEKNVKRLYSIIIYFSLIQCVAITLFAPLIIGILYGEAYDPSINALRLIVWYTTFAYLGSVRNIWILSEDKQKYLWVLNLSGAVANVVLNAFFIPLWGIIGAAFASLVTQIFTNVIMGFIMKPIRRNNSLMLQSLNPKYLLELIKRGKRENESK